jgi:hypothetical protein
MTSTLMEVLDADQRRALENVREAVERIWARPLHHHYTDHTVDHSERVITLLDGLTAGIMSIDKRLSSTEVFVLLAATFLHDIGMQNEKFAGGDLDEIRAHHNEQTAEMIFAVFEDPARAFGIPLASDPGIVEAVALVAKGHRKVDLADPEYDSFIHSGERVRLRLLAALLRFGDELDIDHRRVDLEQMKLLDLPIESQFHWWKCHYVSGVSIIDEYIRVSYRFPQDRSDYEGLIVPLVEEEICAKHAALEEIFRENGIKVALGRSQVRLMRLVQPLPTGVEAWARQQTEVIDKEASPLPSSTAPFHITMAKARGLGLVIYDPIRKDIASQLTLSIPRKDSELKRSTEVGFRLYLTNNSDRIARYIQIEMFIAATFLAYSYQTDPFKVESAQGWRVEVNRVSEKYRCFLEGGADLVCHTGNPGLYDLGLIKMQVPWGEADGGPIRANIVYTITAEEHTGNGLVTVWLQAADDSGNERGISGPSDSPSNGLKTSVKSDWSTAAIRNLLSAAFDDEDLTVLCFDHFHPVYENFTSGMSKRNKVQHLMDHCLRHGKVEKLLTLVQERNPTQYSRFESKLKKHTDE